MKLINYILYCLLLSAAPIHATAPKAYFVGELGSSWQFPSDHLPIGATLGDFHIAFWNILNKSYLFHIEKNDQGLRHSAILADNRPYPHSKLTVREMIIVQQILEMIAHPTHPRSLIALEETHADVQNALKQQLPGNWVVATPPDQPESQDLFLYDAEVFDFVEADAVKYSPEQPKTIFTLTLREKASQKLFRFVQSHIPGGPVDSPAACARFAKEALRQFDPALTIVLMGDMNQSPQVIEKALKTAAEGLSQPYQHLPIAYPTHVNTKMQASWIDNFFVYAPEVPIRASDRPEELCGVLNPTVDLLRSFTP